MSPRERIEALREEHGDDCKRRAVGHCTCGAHYQHARVDAALGALL